ncbi:MAG TPA: hypothetical protein DEP69_05970 [Acidimicrobiaceae bacterium]|nr:hypothetical protein [Acidimicrobiaceae bacterium]
MSPARPEPSRNRIAATWAVVLAALLAGLAVLPGVELDRRRAEADSAEAHVAALDAAVDAAVAAATTSDPITAAISADIGTSEIKVKFSTAVDKAAAEKTANYNVFGGTLYGSDAVAYDEGTRTATITLQNDKVAAGTTVTLLGGKVTGVGTDLRKVATTDYEVPPAVIDRQRPRLSVIAPEGGHEFAVRITEANPADGEVVVPVEITLRGEKLAADTATLPYDGDAAKGVIVCLFGLVETDATDCEDDRETDDLAPLAAGDRIIVAAGAVKDESGNETRTTSAAVGPNSKTVRLQVATVTAPAARNLAGPDEPARPSVATWTSVGRVDREAQSHVAIAAKPDGAYPGAVGNGWWIQWNDLGAAADADDTADVSVLVIKPRRTIVVSFDDAATPSDAVDALNDDDVFSADFTASFVNREVDGTVDDISDSKTVLPALGLAGAREKLGDGESQVVLTLRYGSILDNFDHDAFRTHGSNENQTEGGWSTAAFTTSTDAPRWVASPSSEEKVLLTNEIKITLNGRNITEFPTPGDSVFLPDGVATDYAGTDSDAEVNPPRRLRPA